MSGRRIRRPPAAGRAAARKKDEGRRVQRKVMTMGAAILVAGTAATFLLEQAVLAPRRQVQAESALPVYSAVGQRTDDVSFWPWTFYDEHAGQEPSLLAVEDESYMSELLVVLIDSILQGGVEIETSGKAVETYNDDRAGCQYLRDLEVLWTPEGGTPQTLTLDMGMGGGSSSEDSAAGTPENGLSQAEQEGIQKLEGVLSKETLDGQLRAVAQYGLEDYTLSSASYRLIEATETQEEQVLCTLRYLLPGTDETASRTFTVDAKTGQVEDLWSYLPWDEDQKPSLTQAEAQTQAEAFLQSFCPDRSAKLALYQGPQGEVQSTYFFTFARQENGYFFPEHFYGVEVSAEDGSICGLSYSYDDGVTFDSPDGIVSAQAALDAWMDTYTVTLGYLQVPEKLSAGDPEAAPYLQLGLTAFYRLKLGYGLDREGFYLGVDAKTGQPVQWETGGASGLTYSDLSGHWAQGAVEALARYNVGYDGGTFAPGQAMTQWDMVALLFSVENYPLDPAAATQQERDMAYAAAYRTGALTRAQRQDDAPLTRSQAVKLLLNAEGLKAAAQLSGIYTCSYTDKAAIPSEDLGYAALAQGIGMVQGAWAGDRTATRAEGAVMLHKLLAW